MAAVEVFIRLFYYVGRGIKKSLPGGRLWMLRTLTNLF
jgi:hypothetical protein